MIQREANRNSGEGSETQKTWQRPEVGRERGEVEAEQAAGGSAPPLLGSKGIFTTLINSSTSAATCFSLVLSSGGD